MIDIRSGYHIYGLNKRFEVVKGKEFSADQTPHMIVQARDEYKAPVPVPPPKTIVKAPKPPKKKNSSKSWNLNNPEMKRKKRVAKYKLYAVEGKVKNSLSKGFRWIKDKCSQMVHGF